MCLNAAGFLFWAYLQNTINNLDMEDISGCDKRKLMKVQTCINIGLSKDWEKTKEQTEK